MASGLSEKQFNDSMCGADAMRRRMLFPRGLLQPEGSYRFGTDALLLAAWARQCISDSVKTQYRKPLLAAELGTGCGAAMLALALALPNMRGTAIDFSSACISAAAANFSALGFDGILEAVHDDVSRKGFPEDSAAGSCDLVFANPPWRNYEEGRNTQSPTRRRALTCLPGAGKSESACACFAFAAAALLRHHGTYCCIMPAAKLPLLLSSFAAAKIGVRSALFVHSRPDLPARAVCVEGKKNAADDMTVHPPLCLFDDADAAKVQRYSAQAFHFSPFLASGDSAAFNICHGETL